MRFATTFAFAVLLAACSPEGFEISACSSEGRLAFRIHEIDGWLWDYQPRPNLVFVRESELGKRETQMMWSARINDPENKRPSRQLMLYGQSLPEWEVEVRPHQLSAGTRYFVYMTDSGRSGEADFFAGVSLPTC